MFKRFMLATLLALFMAPVSAQDLASCDDLTDIANTLDEVSVSFADVGAIREDSAADQALGQIVEGLQLLADSEANNAFTNSVTSLSDSWHAMDWPTFRLALDSVIANIDRIRREDGCEE